MHLQGIGDQTVTSIYTELSSLVLAYLNRDNVMYLATCRNCLRNIPSSAGWAEGRGAKPAAGTPVHDVCAIMLNAGFWQYLYFLGFANPLIIILCPRHKYLFQQVRGLSNTQCLLLSAGYGQVISSAWKAGATAKPCYHAGMCCLWFFFMPKSNNICLSKYNYNKDYFASMTATLGQARVKLSAVQRFSKYGHFIPGQFCRPRADWQTADWFFFFFVIYAVCLACSQWSCTGWIWKI